MLEKGAKNNPHQILMNEYLATAYLKAGKVDLGTKEIEKLLREKSRQAVPLLHELFEILVVRKNYQAIIDIMKKGVMVDPENIFLREYLIFAYLKTGKETLAISEMEKILEQKPDDMELWLQLARLSEKKNQIPKSIKAYRRVLDLYPEHPEASEAYLRLRLEGVGED
jgi:tetratricopeptide (TPR) repeat protein